MDDLPDPQYDVPFNLHRLVSKLLPLSEYDQVKDQIPRALWKRPAIFPSRPKTTEELTLDSLRERLRFLDVDKHDGPRLLWHYKTEDGSLSVFILCYDWGDFKSDEIPQYLFPLLELHTKKKSSHFIHVVDWYGNVLLRSSLFEGAHSYEDLRGELSSYLPAPGRVTRILPWPDEWVWVWLEQPTQWFEHSAGGGQARISLEDGAYQLAWKFLGDSASDREIEETAKLALQAHDRARKRLP